MNQLSFLSLKRTGQALDTREKKWLISRAIGLAAVILIIVSTGFACSKPPVTELIVEDLVVGTGKEAKLGDTLVVEYIGWVYGADKSKPFDMSGQHDTAFDFILGKGEAIAGWDQGLVGMKVGGQRKLTIPAKLAYGEKGALNGKIPPNAALIFEVELKDALTPLAELPPTSVKKLKVEDLVVGTGATAQIGKTLTVHYTGWLEDGTQFDSTYDAGGPIEFPLGISKVIQGWEQGLMGMKAGGKRKLTIPPHLAYGTKGSKNYVPPNAALIFEVELVGVR